MSFGYNNLTRLDVDILSLIKFLIQEGSEAEDSDEDEPMTDRNFDTLEKRILTRNKYRQWANRR